MALRGRSSNSFLRSKDLISFSEISYDKYGNNIVKNRILQEALARDRDGNLIRNKSNIANILNRYGVIYRMVFNAMNMDRYTIDEVQEALDHLSEYINDLGVSGIVEFHASDKTQNSDHIHFWISSEDRLIYNKIAQEMVAMGYSNEEDIYIQKYEDNSRIDRSEYVNSEDSRVEDRFLVDDNRGVSSLREKYNSIVDNIGAIFQKVMKSRDDIEEKKRPKSLIKSSIIEDCSLPRTEKINTILLRIKELSEKK